MVARATARDPADRYADALQLGAELDAIAAELALPEFRVPAPRNSAQHRSAALYHSQIQQEQVGGHTRQTTRKLTREMPADADPVDYQAVSGQFAGIELSEFALARQHAQRMVLVWLAIVLAVTGLVAAAAWTIGSNLNGLL
ncbi:putative serine/threonine-kinase pknL domain protein [Mycobacterium xenopi 4042]|uniref:Putative serine/threonine-kinase pknL domain protein n=1 Tax=Mycobacterium xenopi 4042 TaxID=1299334 RepID=X7ZY43_MYCXE|nr:putative serine/threonine-kinase pknL domain protein [Mycobacterium xenopi 4042]EUA27976.1 putative serine/threonine-kinase pknL domain protein [Mycobacterium xenopi 3993]